MGNGDMKRSAIAAMAAASLMVASGPVLARSADSTEANRAFVKEVVQGDLAEVQIGKLAQERGASEKAKQFGQKLEDDHGANLKKVKALAESLGVTPPATPDAKQQSTYDRLSSFSGQSFDRRFAKKMVQDHKKDIKAFQQKSRGSGPVADFAKQTLPTLEEHLKLAKALSGMRT